MFKRALSFNHETVFYFDAYDNKYVAKGGGLAWLLMNPGLVHSQLPVSSKIGSHASYAVFPTHAAGLRALQEWLKSVKKTPLAVAERYCPKDPGRWLCNTLQRPELKPNAKHANLTNADLPRLTTAICELCDAKPGTFALLPKISKRYTSNDRSIEYYLVGFDTMLTKQEALLWIETHRLDAVIAHKRNETTYLRSRPGHRMDQIHIHNNHNESEDEVKNAIRDVGTKREGQCVWGFINGIWNDDFSAAESTNIISKLTHGEQVWSLINNTQSKRKDLLECGHLMFGHNREIVKLAVKFFQLLIKISEQDPKKPKIIVFVHSQGAIIADLALDLLNTEERRKIRIFSFGGGSLIAPDKAHPESHNYASVADPIPRLGAIELMRIATILHERKEHPKSRVIDWLIEEDAANYLDAPSQIIKDAFRKERRVFYSDLLKKLENVSILSRSKDDIKIEHTFVAACYQDTLREVIEKYLHENH